MRASPCTARRPFRRARPLLGIVALLALAAILLAGCGDSGGSGVARADDAGADSTATTGGASTTAASSDPEQAQLDFARCMREQGLDFPDPQPDANGNLRFQIPAGGAGGREAFRAAGEKCQKYLQAAGGGLPDPDDPEFQDAQLEFARCMRGEGLDFPDPTPGQGPGQGAAIRIDQDDPAVQAAFDKCAPAIQGTFGRGGGQ
jgi:hypothetical protein